MPPVTRQRRSRKTSERHNPVGKPKMQGNKSTKKKEAAKPKALPVTLLSGFLGSGKTTLLQHILTANHGYKIAVVVNDIGAVNVDANIIQHHRLTQADKKVVALQNGCICCTLRGDLLEELVNLSKMNEFDYILIESSGISEPEQVAESFDDRLAEHITAEALQGEVDESMVKVLKEIKEAGGMGKFAYLDTAVTVIDAFNMLNDFNTDQLLSHRRDDVTPEDERTVSDLMVDQIEFANVVILNKLDMLKGDQKKKDELIQLVKNLNHDAKIIETNHGVVDPKDIVATGLFDLEHAKNGAGWLQDLHEMTVRQVNGRNVVAPKPETEEYDIGNFIYARSRPFHPLRLHKLLQDKFIFRDEDDEEDDEDEEEEEEDEVDAENRRRAEEASIDDDSTGSSNGATDATVEDQSTPVTNPDDEDEYSWETLENEVVLANKRAHPVFSGLYRSKGNVWLASRPNQKGSWSQAGAMLTIIGDMPFFCLLDKEEYESTPAVNEMVQFAISKGGEWGDRETELVFIGYKLDKQALSDLLDACLLNDEEWEQWQTIMREEETNEKQVEAMLEAFEDGWPGWDVDDDGHDHDHDHEDGDHEHDEKPALRNISEYGEALREVD